MSLPLNTTMDAERIAVLTRQRDAVLGLNEEVLRRLDLSRGEVLKLARELADARSQVEVALLFSKKLREERGEARAALSRVLDAIRFDCEDHFGARRACGQCYDSALTHLKNAQAEVARLREALDKAVDALGEEVK